MRKHLNSYVDLKNNRVVYYYLLVFVLISACSGEAQQYAENEEVVLYKVQKPDDRRFDLSGLALYKDMMIAVADKPWNTALYRLQFHDNHTATPLLHQKIDYPFKADFEAVDYDNSAFYVADERGTTIFKADDADSGVQQKLEINWTAIQNATGWGNAGIEGIAVDPQGEKLYIAKERDPARLFVAPVAGGKVEEIFLADKPENFDISDLKYEDGFLYFLNRHNYQVLKWNVERQAWNGAFDYSSVMNAGGEMLYSKSRYPMAEGLLLDERYIWIALDNNGRTFNTKNRWIKEYGFTGDDPVIVRFKRPDNY